MIFCSNCFNDEELRARIISLGHRGDCPTCKSSDTFFYDTEKDTGLNGSFDELISIYKSTSEVPSETPTSLLKHELLYSWDIFNSINEDAIYDIVLSLSEDKYKDAPDLFDTPVGIPELIDRSYNEEHSMLRTNSWEEFVLSLKTRNRYHTHILNTEILERFCTYIRKKYQAGTEFYRGRIADSTGYKIAEMGPPPSEKASAGRANASGIRCLYLASDIDTTIHEVRAGAFDYISVGKFVLKQDIIVVDLKMINRISPFTEGLNCTEYAANKEHLKKIDEEMGKALRRSDSDLDYVPTQYISDFIKCIEHDKKSEYAGLEYNSTMNPKGYNLAIFDPDLFECVDVQTYKINGMVYTKEVVN